MKMTATIRLTAFVFSCLLFFSFKTFAQPANDDCANAIDFGSLPTPGACIGGLEDGAPVTLNNQTTENATGENPYSYLTGCTGGGNMTAPALDTWYSFTATGTTANIDISGFPNASLGVWSGTCGNLAGLACLNVNGSGSGTLTVNQIQIGATYYIQVSGGNATATDNNFTLAVDNDIDCDDCLVQSSLTSTPAPVNGTYLPGQVVTFCFTVSEFSEENTNWFHGVQIDMGAGWTGAITNTVPANDCNYDPTPGPGDAGDGNWAFYNSVTSSATGQTFGQGFYFDNANVAGNDPGQNFGDPTNGNCTWTFCFDLTVDAGCTAGADLSVTINTTGDGESGSWNSIACTGDVSSQAIASMVCCDIPLTTNANESCPGAGDGSATVEGQGGTAPYDYVWEDALGNVVYTDNNNSGVSSYGSLTSGTYTITVTDDNGCVQIVDVTIMADPCTMCPGYGTAVAAADACGGQLYDFEVPNTDCNGTLTFDVIGNFGSADANEITWDVTSNLTTNVVASGGPGTNGGAISVTVSLDPNVEGQYFTLNVYDAFGDGFNGTGGFIQVEDNGSIIAGPITGDFGASSAIIFGANIDISSSTLTITTPSGNVVNVASNCDNHDVQFTLDNTNFCNTINVALPWEIVCDQTGGVITSGVHNVTVYPQIATASTDVVDITWNAGTCQWDVSPQNDCDLLDIGTIFNITPDPTAWPANTCANGDQDFTVDYLGVTGGPDCCSTGGPLGPITYNNTTNTGDVTVEDSPFGGTDNSAYSTIAGNGTGGNATALTLTVDMTGYCFPDPPGSGTDDSYWVTIYVDGNIVYDQQQGPPGPANFNTTLNLGSIPGGYNQNSVVEVYIYPNAFSEGAEFTEFVPGVPCGSLGAAEWTASSFDVTLDVTFSEQTTTPANCTFVTNEPYTCCIVTGPAVPPDGASTVNCLADAQVQPADPGVITDACGNTLTPVVTTPADIVCEGDMAWVFTYTDCDGNSTDWTYTYTIDLPVFTIGTPNGSSTVNCPADANVQPAGPGVVTDLCGNTLTPTITTPAAVACEGDMVWTFTYTDCAGNSVDWTHTYTVDMPTFTIVTPPGASTVNCPADGLVQPADAGVVTDVCGNVITPTVAAPTAIACEGDMVWTFTYTDCAGNSVDWTHTYTVDMPTFTIATPPGASTVNCPADGLVQPADAGVVTDICGNVITPTVAAPTAVACEGDMVWTFTYTDCAGNSVDWTHTYTVDMPTFTIATPPGASTVNCPADGLVQPADAGVVTDICGNVITPTVAAPTAVACEGNMVWTFTYTDCAGNSVDWTHTYTVDMPTFTIATPPGASTVNCPADGLVQPADAGVVTDICGNVITPTVAAPTAIACEGDMVWTFTYTDCAGNSVDWTHTYTVDMPTFTIATPPGASTVNCPADGLVQPADAGVVTDVCGNVITPTVAAPTAVACEGDMVWTFTYTDCAGNSVDWTHTYTVDMPTFAIGTPNGTSSVVCVADLVVPTPPAGVVDQCGNTVTPVMTENADPVCVGDKVYTFTYTDCAGNVVVWTHTTSVNDNVPPTGTAPANVSLPGGTPPPCDPNLVTGVSDNCDPSPTVTCLPDVSDGGNCPEIITRTYRIEDNCGNFVDVIQTFTIGDAILPTADTPADINVECASLVPAPNPDVVLNEADNGTTPVVTFEDDTPGGGPCPDTILRRYRVTDDCGNFIFVTQFIIIEPATNPVVPANGASTVNCLADAQVVPTAPAVTDVCGNALTPVVTTPADIVCEGDMVYTFTYTDCAGNTSDWLYTYTVDLPAFAIATPNGSSTVNCVVDANVQPAGPGIITDLCGNTLTPTIIAPAAVTCEGDMVWTFTYTDCAGNTLDWTYTYTVDLPAFAIATPNGSSTVNCVADANVQPAGPGVITDLCGNILTPTITAPAAVACEGDMIWTFTYTDCAGNTLDWTHTYTVDMPAFTIAAAPTTSTVNCPADGLVQPADAGVVTDVCGNVLTPTVTAPAAIACEGDMVWTFTYTDCAGNTLDWTHTYTVDVPAFTIPYANGTATVNCVADAQVDPGAPGVVTDMCGNTLTPVITAPSPAGCTGVGAVWIYTYTDCAGNTLDWTYTYTITLAPFTIATPPGASTVNCPADAMIQPADAGVVNDACGNPIIPTVTPPAAAVPCEGDMVWTFTYTDCAGNTLDWTHTYTVDMPAFVIATPPGASTVNCPADGMVQPADAGVVTDICGNVITPTVAAPTAVACEGDMVWTFTYTDCAGNTLDWTHTYTVDMPAFTIAAAPTTSTVNCPADALVQPADAGVVTDVCGNVITPTVAAPTAVACEGDMVWTFTYTDCAGNTLDWTHTYTVDMPAFTIAAAPTTSTVNCPADGLVQPADAGVVTDVCGNVLTPTVAAPTAVACEGDMVWTFTYTDCAGNTLDWTHTYTVDMPAFTIAVAPTTSIVNCPADGLVQPADAGVVTDVCGNVLTPTVTAPSAVGCTGGMVWTFTYTDCAGNTLDWTHTYTVDMPAFAIATLPGASTVNCPADAMIQPADAGVVNDACGNPIIPTVTPPAAVPCEGDMVWTFTYTDCAGNTLDWTHTYTVDMPVFAIATPPGASTVNCPADGMVQPADAGVVTDICGNVITPTVAAPTAVACEGDMVWTFTYTDCAGNTLDWTHTYTVDMPAFTIAAAPTTSTVNCPADALVQPADAGVVTDMCGNVITPTVAGPTAVACEGDMVWTFTYTDCAGNTSDWTHTYTVDMPAFTIAAVPTTSTVNCPADGLVQPADAGVVTDMCGNVIIPTVAAPTAVACEGDMVWTFTYTDCAGNTLDWTHTYTVDMPAFAIATPPGASTVNCPADGLVQPADAGVVTDVCGNVLTPTVAAPSAVGCQGDMVWTFTYTDCAGNTLDWTHTYTVDMPAFTLPADDASTVNCLVDAQVQPVPPVMTDHCGNAITPTVATPVNIPCEGDMAWVFTYTDCAGNTADWTYTYTIDIPTFVVPSNGSNTVECVSQIVVPTPPLVNDACGNAMTPVMTESADPLCEGDKVYTFTYTDCAGNTADWLYTYTIDMVTPPVVPANGSESAFCVSDIFVPTAPVVTDVCGNAIVPVMTENADPVCVGDKVYTFTYTDCAGNASVWTYTFSINDNVPPTASNPFPISVPGANDVPLPDPTVVFDEADNCTLEPVVAWVSDVSDGNVCNLEEITRTYSVTDDCGNQILVTQQIVILATYPPVDAGPDDLICEGETITLTAGNPWGVPISWSPSNPPVDGQPFAPTQTTTYTVTADNLGCISTDDVTITVEEPPVADFIPDVFGGCAPLTVTFTNLSTSSSALTDCVWEINGETLTGCNTVSYTFDNGGVYDAALTVTSVNGCSGSVAYSQLITVEDVPLAAFTASPMTVSTMDPEVEFTNNSVGASTYAWDFGDNTGSTDENPTHTFPDGESAGYQVELIAYSELYNCSDTAWLTINVEEELIYYVPNTFTPDGDNYNEYFKPVFTSGFDPYDFTLLIFNRWGEIVWESHDASVGWDGTYNGGLVSDGTYVWKIEFKTTATDERVMLTGHVNVLK